MEKKRKNVLFITADQWRGDTLGCVEHPVVKTPHLDQLAGEGSTVPQTLHSDCPLWPFACFVIHRTVRNESPFSQ